LGPSLLAGALTLAVMSLPVIIVAAREAIRAVPDGLRLGAYALGATKWQTVRRQVLPQPAFAAAAAAASIVLLALLLAMNAVAIFLRNRYTIRW
jgi:ABC-type phosphate transport system permease subunit